MLAITSLPISVCGEEASVEIGGVVITRGMPEEDFRATFKSIRCAENAPSNDSKVQHCSFGGGESWEDGGQVSFEDGRVRRITRNWRTSENEEAYELFALLNELLTTLTKGSETCTSIYTYVQSQAPWKSDVIVLVLPEKVVEITTHIVGDRQGVSIQESTRVNPVPTDYKVHAKVGGADNCVFDE